jgi:hypothetical protein
VTSSHHWVLRAHDGSVIRSTESFESRADAEAWLADQWTAAREDGAESVVLMLGDDVIYEMSLNPVDSQ